MMDLMADTSPPESPDFASSESIHTLEWLLEEHREVCWGFLMARMRHVEDAQDALQETWIRAHRAWPRYREQGQFRAWILRIARREALRIQRKNQRRNQGTEIWDAAETPAPDRISEQQDEVLRMHRAIDRLSPKEREAVWLRIVEECTFREIAQIQRVPEGTAVTRVRRGLVHVKNRLTGDTK